MLLIFPLLFALTYANVFIPGSYVRQSDGGCTTEFFGPCFLACSASVLVSIKDSNFTLVSGVAPTPSVCNGTSCADTVFSSGLNSSPFTNLSAVFTQTSETYLGFGILDTSCVIGFEREVGGGESSKVKDSETSSPSSSGIIQIVGTAVFALFLLLL
jgi:hypothetical protein